MIENILNDLKMPISEVIDRVNFCIREMKKAKEKHMPKDRNFYCGDFLFPHCDAKRIDGINSIQKYSTTLCVDGFYKTTEKAITYETTDPYDEGWRIIKGDFEEHVYAYIPLDSFTATEKLLAKEIEKLCKESIVASIKSDLDLLDWEQKSVNAKREKLLQYSNKLNTTKE